MSTVALSVAVPDEPLLHTIIVTSPLHARDKILSSPSHNNNSNYNFITHHQHDTIRAGTPLAVSSPYSSASRSLSSSPLPPAPAADPSSSTFINHPTRSLLLHHILAERTASFQERHDVARVRAPKPRLIYMRFKSSLCANASRVYSHVVAHLRNNLPLVCAALPTLPPLSFASLTDIAASAFVTDAIHTTYDTKRERIETSPIIIQHLMSERKEKMARKKKKKKIKKKKASNKKKGGDKITEETKEHDTTADATSDATHHDAANVDAPPQPSFTTTSIHDVASANASDMVHEQDDANSEDEESPPLTPRSQSFIPYIEQGNLDFYTLPQIEARLAIKFSHQFLVRVQEWWLTHDTHKKIDGKECIDLEEFIHTLLAIYELLFVDLNDEQMTHIISADINELLKNQETAKAKTIKRYELSNEQNNDPNITTPPKGTVNFVEFHEAMFRIIDHWTETTDMQEYLGALDTFYRVLTEPRLSLLCTPTGAPERTTTVSSASTHKRLGYVKQRGRAVGVVSPSSRASSKNGKNNANNDNSKSSSAQATRSSTPFSSSLERDIKRRLREKIQDEKNTSKHAQLTHNLKSRLSQGMKRDGDTSQSDKLPPFTPALNLIDSNTSVATTASSPPSLNASNSVQSSTTASSSTPMSELSLTSFTSTSSYHKLRAYEKDYKINRNGPTPRSKRGSTSISEHDEVASQDTGDTADANEQPFTPPELNSPIADDAFVFPSSRSSSSLSLGSSRRSSSSSSFSEPMIREDSSVTPDAADASRPPSSPSSTHATPLTSNIPPPATIHSSILPMDKLARALLLQKAAQLPVAPRLDLLTKEPAPEPAAPAKSKKEEMLSQAIEKEKQKARLFVKFGNAQAALPSAGSSSAASPPLPAAAASSKVPMSSVYAIASMYLKPPTAPSGDEATSLHVNVNVSTPSTRSQASSTRASSSLSTPASSHRFKEHLLPTDIPSSRSNRSDKASSSRQPSPPVSTRSRHAPSARSSAPQSPHPPTTEPPLSADEFAAFFNVDRTRTQVYRNCMFKRGSLPPFHRSTLSMEQRRAEDMQLYGSVVQQTPENQPPKSIIKLLATASRATAALHNHYPFYNPSSTSPSPTSFTSTFPSRPSFIHAHPLHPRVINAAGEFQYIHTSMYERLRGHAHDSCDDSPSHSDDDAAPARTMSSQSAHTRSQTPSTSIPITLSSYRPKTCLSTLPPSSLANPPRVSTHSHVFGDGLRAFDRQPFDALDFSCTDHRETRGPEPHVQSTSARSARLSINAQPCHIAPISTSQTARPHTRG